MTKELLLFIGIGFHQFDEFIKEDLSKRYNVCYVCSNKYINKHPALSKILATVCPRLLDFLSERDVAKQLNAIDDQVSKLFVIKGEHLNVSHLEFLYRKFNISNKVLYLWDSWKNHKNLDVIAPLFDEVYSFDSKDCKDLGLKFRPLFYFKSQIKIDMPKIIDVAFVGGDHSDRYQKISYFKNLCLSNNWSYSINLLVGRVTFFKYCYPKWFATKYSKNDVDILIGKPLSYKDYVNIVSKANVIVDMPATGQTGLTMRTIEALAMGAKLITTNSYILEYEDIPAASYLVWNESSQEKDIVDFVNDKVSKVMLPSRYESSYALKEMI